MLKKLKKRGVSPVIATVLLISMVIIIGIIIFLWFRGIIGETTKKFEKNIELVCDEVIFDASYSGGVLFVSNNGDVPIYGISVKIESPGSHTTKNLNETSDWEDLGEYGLQQGKTFSGELTSISGADKLILTPILYGKTESGEKKTFVCDEKRHGIEVLVF